MGLAREERLAQNEAMFREANQRAHAWDERHLDNEIELYFCECGKPGCREKVSLGDTDYERVRSNPRRFVIVLGHELPEVETVIEQHEGWAVVEKEPEVTEVVDPRRDG